ncbi:MAG: hypothetical protein SOR72_04775 [Hornefia sp.]|nr:hypothetical protein [Hornefia sp.]
MAYFLSHIGYILIAGVFVALIGAVWAMAAIKWQNDKAESGETDPPGCAGCAGCGMMNQCGKSRAD